jgi:hypothetical protein
MTAPKGRIKRLTEHPLFPVPKVYVPTVAGWIAALQVYIATGTFDRLTLSLLVSSTLYAVIGWATPKS